MRNFRYAVRTLRKSPVFTATAVGTLALSIGANTAIYSVVDRVLLRALPYPEPERLAQVMTHFERRGNDEVGQTGGTWEELRDRITTAEIAVTGAGIGMGVNLAANGQPQYVQQQRVSANFFATLGVLPALGREFTRDEDRPDGPTLAILSDSLWKKLGSDPAIVGRSIMLRGAPHTVVGVMPSRFTTGSPADVWTPLRPSRRGEGGGQNYAILARLHRGVTWAQADAEFAAAGQASMDDLYRGADNRARVHLVPLQRGETQAVRRPILILWAAVGFVLLIGCVNIAGLLMARGVTRAPEIATRMALGGGRSTIVREQLAESLVIAACGGALGLLVGYAGSRVFAPLLEDAFGVTGEVGLDLRVLAITSVIALSTSIVFGLLPALQASAVNLRETLVASGSPSIAGGARSWPRRVMVAAEVAVGVMMLVGAGLLTRSFTYLVNQRPGFDGTNVMTATLSLQDARYEEAARATQLFDETLARMRAVAGVQNAAVALTLPYERALNNGFRWSAGTPGYVINLTYVTPGYFETLRIPIRRGRAFTDADSASGAPVIVVNESFVRRHSPDQDPIGRQLLTGGVARTIVGIAGDIQTKVAFGSFGPVAAAPAAYFPAAQASTAMFKLVHTWFAPSWFVRTSGPLASVAADMQRAVQSVDPLLPFAKFRTLDELRGEAVATPRAQAMLLGTLASLALLLAAVGLYGLVANGVAERTRELGIRMALGASTTRAVLAAALPGVVLAAIGVSVGLVAARLEATVLRHLIWGIGVDDPLTFAMAGGVMFVVALGAALVPSIRVARLNPIRALRIG